MVQRSPMHFVLFPDGGGALRCGPPRRVLYFITRPTDTFNVDWPAVNSVSAEKPLMVEDWTLRVLETNADDSRWRFEVVGSQTGKDGEGVSTERFVSRSGRVLIEPTDYGVKRAFDLRHILTPAGFEVKWRVEPMFRDVYRAPRVADPSREESVILALGLANLEASALVEVH